MNTIKTLGLCFLIFLGGAMFIYGGYDDSPGAQGLALIIVLFATWRIYKLVPKKPDSH